VQVIVIKYVHVQLLVPYDIEFLTLVALRNGSHMFVKG